MLLKVQTLGTVGMWRNGILCSFNFVIFWPLNQSMVLKEIQTQLELSCIEEGQRFNVWDHCVSVHALVFIEYDTFVCRR